VKTVIEIADAGYCSGCGVCAGVCPSEALRIDFNKYGELRPYINEILCNSCGICLKVCPFSDESENEDKLGEFLFSNIQGIKHDQYLGYFKNNYVGYSNSEQIRLSSASGGITTHLLINLLDQKIVDYVACVLPNNSKYPHIFSYQLLNDSNDVVKGSKSVYFPVEASQIIRKIIKIKTAKIAFVGLPCTIKAVRNAIKCLPGKFKGIEIIFFGLTCGGMRSKAYSEYILKKNSGIPENISSITYREKKKYGKSNEKGYHFEWLNNENHMESLLCWDHKKYWGDQYFKLNSCQFCDDIFAELADICLMDAWLPEFIEDWQGNNLVITRNNELNKLVKQLKNNETLSINEIEKEKVIQSQIDTIYYKKEGVQYRLNKLLHKKKWIPKKRVKPLNAGSQKDHFRWDYTEKIRKSSREIWAKQKDPDYLDEKIDSIKEYHDLKKRFLKTSKKIKNIVLQIFR